MAWGGESDLSVLPRGPQRFHVVTEDPDAEADRLEALGATPVDRVGGACVLSDPGGNRFVVVAG